MADTETRDVQHYKVFELVRIDVEPRELKNRERELSPLITQVPVAIFDDKDKLDLYVQAAGWRHNEEPSKIPGGYTPTENEQGYFVREEWKEQKPEQAHFNLPFNPEYVKVEQEAAPAPSDDASVEQPAKDDTSSNSAEAAA